jgi:hypothetical protein
MKYNYTFMDEAKLKEIEEILAGEKGTALVAWSLECAKAGIDGYRNGLIKGGLIAAAGAGLAAGGYWVAQKIAKKRVAGRLEAEKKET